MAPFGTRCAVIGLGNPGRGDDAAGRAVVGLLRGTLSPRVAIIEAGGEATELIAEFEDVASAFLVDACASGAAPGTVRRFDVRETPLPRAAFGVSTHGFGLAEAIELARALDRLPARCIVYAIEGASFETGARLSPPVVRAVADVAARLRAEIAGQEGAELESACTKPR